MTTNPDTAADQAEIRRLSEENRRIKGILRSDLTPEQKVEALRIGRIEFKSAGATRKR